MARDIYEQSLYLRDLFRFFDTRPAITSRPCARPVPRPMRLGFVFDDVGFQYPGSGGRWAVRHVSFELRPGERVALVGENGAGKTTLTKLLARLYDPTEGRVLLDGTDLREYDLAQVRHAIGVIFQDFVRYDFRLDENIGIGEIGGTQDYLDHLEGIGSDRTCDATSVSNAIAMAAQWSTVATLVPRLPHGYRQMLGKRFEGGIDLSGGEWQKVALARAYMRAAQVVVLDEPTAALDARAEYDVFLRFFELATQRTALIISHRFSTVRMADRILVLDCGTIVDEGTHEELITRHGVYRELFTLQAKGYH